MATPAAVLSILLEANSSSAGRALAEYQGQLETVNTHAGKVESSTHRMNSSINSVKKPAESATKSMSGLAKSVLAAGGAFAAFEAAKNAIESTVELGHAVERLSAITGLDTKTASTWIEAMKVRGGQTKQVSQAFITLSKNIRNAQEAGDKQSDAVKTLVAQQKQQRDALEATGASHQKLAALEAQQQLAMTALQGKTTTATKAFQELGVSQKDLASGNTQKVLLDVADGLSKIKNPADRAALAQQAFGRGAQVLLPVLSQGRKGVLDMLGAAQKYGAFLPNSSKATAGAVEAQRNLKLANDGLKISFTQAVLPVLVKAVQGVLGFITQMRNGTGAGGQFAGAIKRAFDVIKSAVTTVVGAVGGLGNAMSLLVASFVASKVVAFGGAVKDMLALLKASPVIAVTTVVGFLITAFSLLSGHQRTAAQSARDVANAWDQVRNAGNALRDAHLAVVQANIDITRTSQEVTQAEQAKKQAFDRFGAKSPQYKQASLDLKQADLDHKEAVDRLSDSLHTVTADQADASSKVIAAIGVSRGVVAQDKARINSINTQIKALGHQGGQLSQIHQLEGQASAATRQLAHDQNDLNNKLNSMPQARLTTIDLNVDFQSNMAGAIAAIAKSIGGSPLSKTPPFPLPAHHFSGGMVTQPGYFAGEEAPRHPEVILATNPAYRQRNLGLFAQAGAMLGVPGFATGGITPSTGNMASGAEPWAAKTAGAWMKPIAGSWVNKIADQLKKSLFSGGSGSTAADASLWVSAGGPAAVAQIMGAISMAESGGRDIVQQGQPYGSTGWGRWQITPGNSEPQFGVDQALLIPMNNAHAAIAKYNSQGLGAWTTYTSGAYKRFLGAAGSPGVTLPTTGGGGLGSFDGLQVASWIIPELMYAQKHGWTGRITSGYRAGFDPHAPSGSMHALTAYPGGAVDFGGMVDPAGAANRAAFMAAAAGYTGERLIVPQGFRDDGHMSGTGHRRGGIFGHFAKGGIHGRVPHFANGGIPGLGTKALAAAGLPTGGGFGVPKRRLVLPTSVATSPISKLIGIPNLPHVGGAAPTTIEGAQKLAGTISGLRQRITGLTGDYGTLDQYFNINPPQLTDTDGNVIQAAVNQRLAQLNRLVAIRQQIFELWGRVVVYTQRLVEANHAILAGLHTKLTGNIATVQQLEANLGRISTKGLKGKALAGAIALRTSTTKQITGAKAIETATRASIGKYQGNLTSAIADATSATGSRTSSWLDVLDTRSQRAAVAATTGTASATAGIPVDTSGTDTSGVGGPGTVDNSTQLALLQTLLTQSQQTTAVANAQFNVLKGWQQTMPPFGGSFATGGVVPGPAGSPRTIVAHGGETVSNGAPVVHVHVAPAMSWLKDFISVEVQQGTRSMARSASRKLPGSR